MLERTKAAKARAHLTNKPAFSSFNGSYHYCMVIQALKCVCQVLYNIEQEWKLVSFWVSKSVGGGKSLTDHNYLLNKRIIQLENHLL